MKQNLIFRAWYYFRTGWQIYFAFIMSAVNTLVVTYYLAIDNLPFLKEIFPSFIHYVSIISFIGIPILIIAGYVHFKKSAAFKSEADISIESNPHLRRILLNTEAIIQSDFKITQLIIKIINNEKLTEDEITEMVQLRLDISKYLDKRTISDENFSFTKK